MAKIAIIGAGSIGFARTLITDVLSFPGMKGTTFALMDIDQQRLDLTRRLAERTIKEGGFQAKLECTLERREALEGADYVLVVLQVGGVKAIECDIEVPLKYGVDQSVGDTLGPGGVFRALRTVPIMLDICRDMEEIRPEAILLNYTNPMGMLTRAMFEASSIRAFGLCHSVQGTANGIADWLNVPFEEMNYQVAGINHQAWFLKLCHKGVDLYPRLREKLDDPEIYGKDVVRFEMLRHLDYFVTESSRHNSEYMPWIRKRNELVEKFCPGGGKAGGTGDILRVHRIRRPEQKQMQERMASGEEPLDLKRSREYGAYIINAIETNEPFVFNGNVRNTGLITNLPERSCVEVPCIASGNGITPTFVGELPAQCAALNRNNLNVQELAVRAALDIDRHKAFQAIAFDPLTGSVLSLDEIQAMVDEMFETQKQWLPQFSS